MKLTILGLAFAAVAVAGCSKPETKPAETAQAAPARPYNTNVATVEVMEHVMNPAGYKFWGGWGTIVDKNGEHDLTPKNDAEWKVVEDGAATIVIATNALMVPGYIREPEAEWNKDAKIVADIAWEGKQAAERKDSKAVGDIGERLDAACDVCHAKFAIPPQ